MTTETRIAKERVITTGRLELRELRTDDAVFIHALTNDPDWIRYIGDRGIRTLDDARGYILKGPVASYDELGFGLWAVARRDDPAPMGLCGLIKRPWLEDVDIGFAFLPQYRHAGYAMEAAQGTVEYAKDVLGMQRLMAIVSPENADSVRLLTKLGMQFARMEKVPPGEEEVAVYSMPLA